MLGAVEAAEWRREGTLATAFRRASARLLPYGLMFALYAALRVHALGSFSPRNYGVTSSPAGAVAFAGGLFARYLAFLAVPFPTRILASVPPPTLLSPVAVAGLLALGMALLGLLAAAWSGRARREVFLPLAMIVAFLLPVLAVNSIGGSNFSERYVYLPSVGLAWLFGLLVSRLAEILPGWPRKAAAAVALAGLAALGVASWARAEVYRSDLTLFRAAVHTAPDSEIARNNLGMALYNRGHLDEAEREYQHALRLDPKAVPPLANLAVLYEKRGDVPRAEKTFHEVLRLSPWPHHLRRAPRPPPAQARGPDRGDPPARRPVRGRRRELRRPRGARRPLAGGPPSRKGRSPARTGRPHLPGVRAGLGAPGPGARRGGRRSGGRRGGAEGVGDRSEERRGAEGGGAYMICFPVFPALEGRPLKSLGFQPQVKETRTFPSPEGATGWWDIGRPFGAGRSSTYPRPGVETPGSSKAAPPGREKHPEPPLTTLICPVRDCGEPLERRGASLACPRGHSFDVARGGYVNLLQPQDRKSKNPGDPRAAVEARRRLLDAGYGEPLLRAIREEIAALGLGAGAAVLDVGCGEGYYLGSLARDPEVEAHGVDLSATAVDLAARRYPQGTWIVANADRFLPWAAGSFDLILSIDARLNPAEMRRVLKDGGRLLVAVPGPDDLVELREAVLGEGRLRDRLEGAAGRLADDFALEASRTVRGAAELGAAEIRDALLATYRGGRESRRERIETLSGLPVTLSHELARLRKR